MQLHRTPSSRQSADQVLAKSRANSDIAARAAKDGHRSMSAQRELAQREIALERREIATAVAVRVVKEAMRERVRLDHKEAFQAQMRAWFGK